MINTRKCLICNGGKKNDVLYWHQDPETQNIWCYCTKEGRGYSIESYCHKAGISLAQFLKNDFEFTSAVNNEINAMEWPKKFIPLSDPRSKTGADYIKSRGLTLDGNWYYDLDYNGIVFPYYFDNVFAGAQIRLIEPWVDDDDEIIKVTTIPGTRVGLLIWSYNQVDIMPHVKAFIVCEGAFNAASLQQSLDLLYGGVARNPFKAIAINGSGGGEHIQDVLRDLKSRNYKVICSTDNDEAGLKCFKKLHEGGCLTHYAFTDTESDWNDELKRIGHGELSKYFLKRVKSIT